MGNGCDWTYQPSNIQRTSLYIGYNRLLLKMGESCSPGRSKDTKRDQVHQVSRALPLVCPNESSTIMGTNSSSKHSRGSVINSESKVHHQRHTIQLPMALQKLSTRLSANFLRSLFWKVNRLGWEIGWLSLRLPHKGENPNKGHSILLSVWIWSHTTIEDSNSIFMYCLGNRDDTQG